MIFLVYRYTHTLLAMLSRHRISLEDPAPMTKTCTETDSFGKIEVPAHRYWGAQAERSRGGEKRDTLRRVDSFEFSSTLIRSPWREWILFSM